jgi:excisionase family DNA binding protein
MKMRAKPGKSVVTIDTPQTFNADEPRYDVPETAKRITLSRGFVYRELAAGNLAHLRVGNKIFIPESAITEYLQSKFKPARRRA